MQIVEIFTQHAHTSLKHACLFATLCSTIKFVQFFAHVVHTFGHSTGCILLAFWFQSTIGVQICCLHYSFLLKILQHLNIKHTCNGSHKVKYSFFCVKKLYKITCMPYCLLVKYLNGEFILNKVLPTKSTDYR